MRTFEMLKEVGSDPMAGEAKMEFVEGPVETQTNRRHLPYRNGDTIVIPHSEWVQIFQLEPEWKQFMLLGYDRNDNVCHFFGGTDESPFLVRLSDQEPFRSLSAKGPAGFYYEIEPYAPSATSDMKRQGDIFAFKLAYSLKEIENFFLAFGEELEMREVKKKDVHIFGTRHMLAAGNYVEAKLGDNNTQTIVEGAKIVAPDHKDLKLSKGFHLLKQTRHLYNPKEAD